MTPEQQIMIFFRDTRQLVFDRYRARRDKDFERADKIRLRLQDEFGLDVTKIDKLVDSTKENENAHM